MKKTAILFLTVIILLFVCLVACDNGNDTPEHNHKHILDDAGICTVCGQHIGNTEGIIYELSDDGSYAMVMGYNGTATKIKIAESYQGVPVKEIYRESFMHNDKITSVVIPDSVTTIGYYALSDCDSLTSVVFGDSVTTIVHYAFADCDSLTSIIIGDSVTTIGMSAFEGCNFTFTEYDNCKYLGNGDNPYYLLIEATDKDLSSYTIHSNTIIIAGYAFTRCDNLKSIEIPDNVIGISSSAFEYCRSLTSVVIGDSVTTIDDYAFSRCSELASVVISDNVTTIGEHAFSSCYSLKDVYYTGSEEEWGEISIGPHNPNLTKIINCYNYVPEE